MVVSGCTRCYFFTGSVIVMTRVRARSTVPIARPNALPTARPTVFAFRELVEPVAVAFDFRRSFVVAFVPVGLAFAAVFFVFLLMTCAFGSISRCLTRFFAEGFFLRGCVFFAKIFRMIPPRECEGLFSHESASRVEED